ncbi:hypothetical protein [Flavobacterium sp.]|uniref:hypothetical protein n=1 Tax=Flavobacterium sp. TaxID=239 RepID=UPI003529459A
MIDFIKLIYRDNGEFKELVMDKKNFPDLEGTFVYHTGEIKPYYKTKFVSLDVRVSEESGNIKNSLHKFYNQLKLSEDQNYNDFGYYSLSEAIDIIQKKFKVINEGKLTQLEFGLNIVLDRPPDSIVRGNFILHKDKAGSSENFRGSGELKRFIHSNYIIKVYDKGMQFNQEINILRFEIKFTKALEFRSMEIYFLYDLKNKVILRKLFLYLIKRFDEIVIVDEFSTTSLKDSNDYNDLIKYTNPLFWSEEMKGVHPQTKKRENDKFKKLLIKNDLLITKKYIRKLLFEKFINLMNS